MPAFWAGKGNQLNTMMIAAASAAVKPRECGEAGYRPDKNWKPYPCLLTRREMQDLVADQLG